MKCGERETLKFTFINALESSPVHWEKSRPSGKQRRPGYDGTADTLQAKAVILGYTQ